MLTYTSHVRPPSYNARIWLVSAPPAYFAARYTRGGRRLSHATATS